MNWYVLFVRTGYEQKVKQVLKKQTDFSLFIPLGERIFKTSGIVKKELYPLFPGYVFIESALPDKEFLQTVRTLKCLPRDIICILRYSDTEIAIRESEKCMLLNLLNINHCIELSTGIIEGDKVHIINGPLKGMESLVKKINRHKRRAWIELEFMGQLRLINVALEIVKKT